MFLQLKSSFQAVFKDLIVLHQAFVLQILSVSPLCIMLKSSTSDHDISWQVSISNCNMILESC